MYSRVTKVSFLGPHRPITFVTRRVSPPSSLFPFFPLSTLHSPLKTRVPDRTFTFIIRVRPLLHPLLPFSSFLVNEKQNEKNTWLNFSLKIYRIYYCMQRYIHAEVDFQKVSAMVVQKNLSVLPSNAPVLVFSFSD